MSKDKIDRFVRKHRKTGDIKPYHRKELASAAVSEETELVKQELEKNPPRFAGFSWRPGRRKLESSESKEKGEGARVVFIAETSESE